MTSEEIREVERFWAKSAYVREVVANATAREGLPCRVNHDPINGVVVVCDRPGLPGPSLVELTHADVVLLLIETGRAFARLLRG